MAELLLSSAGRALGSRLPGQFGQWGARMGAQLGASIGRGLDDAIFGTGAHRYGPRMDELHLQGASEGAGVAQVFGRMRLAGQLIWAAKFKEHRKTERAAGGGKGGGPKVTSYRYTISFAIGLCEGPNVRVERAWANGQPLDLVKLNWRLHPGAEDQAPDPLIEAIEGEAPAYRGLAYVVFEDFPLDDFGAVLPQLSFEVARAASVDGASLEALARGVCLIPGAGEFVYATDVVRRTVGPGEDAVENMSLALDQADLTVSLDQLQASLPHVETVMLTPGWFGDDLRAGLCQIRPGVDRAEKDTRPFSWRAGGVDRGGARLISTHNGGPAYGGTPADQAIVQAIQAAKARGLKVGLNPFLFMDIAAGNALPDPYGGAAQAAYPWRGRITVHPAAGRPGTVDKTIAAATQIDDFFGAAAASHFGIVSGAVTYSGPSAWRYRRFVLHYAKLAVAAGGVDLFVIGSELRGLTTARGAANAYPAVTHLIALANEARAILGPSVKITYAADWSEYFGHQPADGSGDVFFHLDPLWAASPIDAVGVDWYPPLSDWRDGATHADAAFAGAHDPAYLQAGIEGGEAYAWYYADPAARAAQVRTPISDGAYGKPWVFRPKDLRNWWANAHFNRPGGTEQTTPTAWVPQSKPILLLELGCPAVNKGANAPNLFVDPKSAEGALPVASDGGRDDLIQRRALEAYLGYWAPETGNNPTSTQYAGRMIDPAWTCLWAWDARPFPAFPGRTDVWSDGGNWRFGHWLNGRAGVSDLGAVVRVICARAGHADADVGGLSGVVAGYALDGPVSARDALAPLMRVFQIEVLERGGRLVFQHAGVETAMSLDHTAQGEDSRAHLVRADHEALARSLRLRFIDLAQDYRLGAVSAHWADGVGQADAEVEAPLALSLVQAQAIADALLERARAEAEALELELATPHLGLEPGDRITLDALGQAATFRIISIEDGLTRKASLARTAPGRSGMAALLHAPAPPVQAPIAPSKPEALVLDLPPLPGWGTDDRPLAAVRATPWTGPVDLYLGADAANLSLRGQASAPAAIGALLWALYPGPVGRWDEGNVVRILMPGVALSSVSARALLDGANGFAVRTPSGRWEILQARQITLVAPQTYELRGFLRGLQGTGAVMGAPTPVGAPIVRLDAALARLDLTPAERHGQVQFTAVEQGRAPTDAAAASQTVTLQDQWALPFAPVHVRAQRQGNQDIGLSWVRCARMETDAWGPGDAPVGEDNERYQIEVWAGGVLKRLWETSQPSATYPIAAQTADFGGPAPAFSLKIRQISARAGPGQAAEASISV